MYVDAAGRVLSADGVLDLLGDALFEGGDRSQEVVFRRLQEELNVRRVDHRVVLGRVLHPETP